MLVQTLADADLYRVGYGWMPTLILTKSFEVYMHFTVFNTTNLSNYLIARKVLIQLKIIHIKFKNKIK